MPRSRTVGGPELLDDQQAYFIALTEEVKKLAGKEPADAEAAVPAIMAALRKQERIARYVGTFLVAQVEKAFVEMGGKPFPKRTAAAGDHTDHALAHGYDLKPRSRSNSKVFRAAK